MFIFNELYHMKRYIQRFYILFLFITKKMYRIQVFIYTKIRKEAIVMKIKQLVMTCMLLLCSMLPVRAETSQNIMLVSDQIPYIIVADLQDDTMQVNMIPSHITLPLPDVNQYPSALNTLDYTTRIETIRKTVSSFYDIPIDNVVNVHLDEIAKELNISLSDYDFSEMGDITAFFEQVADKVHISMVFNYSHYITSDMGLSSYYDIYTMFQEDVDITYAYASHFMVDDLCMPLDNCLKPKT